MVTVTPAGGKHAIKNVIFALEWQTPLDPSVIAQISALHDKFREKLPRKLDQQAVTINIGAVAQPPSTPAIPQIVGVIFDRTKPDGEPEWSINVNQNILIVQCGAYSRWIPIRDEAFTYFRSILPLTLEHHPISTIGLQYTDEFAITGEFNNAPFDRIFDSKSRYIPQNASQLTDLWHNHHGFFERFEATTAHRRLTNVNVTLVNQADRRLVQIISSHKCLLDAPTADWRKLIESQESILLTLFEKMHVLNKTIMCDLLNADIRKQIGLE
ncbi:MAG: TIGR04255 family protein [Betaproteobacteria bacterium]|nr:TIGR04255 family protein [Betaproteobacteria bacterium]